MSNIAFFDSGQGGLTVWESVVQLFPTLNTVYLGDNARYPYGNKSADIITKYASESLFWLARHGAGMIVVACGTASSVAVDVLKPIFKIPVIGIVDGFCDVAVEEGKKHGRIGVLGTRFTVSSGTLAGEIKKLGGDDPWQKACPLFVPLVEEGLKEGPLVEETVKMYLEDIPEDLGVLMLACTHFPRLRKGIAKVLHEKTKRTVLGYDSLGVDVLYSGSPSQKPIVLMDSSISIVSHVKAFLHSQPQKDLYFESLKKVYCTDSPERFFDVARLFTSISLPPIEKVILG